jgi:hypothetical protein
MGAGNPVAHLLGVAAGDVSDENRAAAKRGLAQILLGRAAELAFEDIYRTQMGHAGIRAGRSARGSNGYGLPGAEWPQTTAVSHQYQILRHAVPAGARTRRLVARGLFSACDL